MRTVASQGPNKTRRQPWRNKKGDNPSKGDWKVEKLHSVRAYGYYAYIYMHTETKQNLSMGRVVRTVSWRSPNMRADYALPLPGSLGQVIGWGLPSELERIVCRLV